MKNLFFIGCLTIMGSILLHSNQAHAFGAKRKIASVESPAEHVVIRFTEKEATGKPASYALQENADQAALKACKDGMVQTGVPDAECKVTERKKLRVPMRLGVYYVSYATGEGDRR
jgi:hypothetical protein